MFSFSFILLFLYQAVLSQRTRTIRRYTQSYIEKGRCMIVGLVKRIQIHRASCQEGQARALEYGWKMLFIGKSYSFQGSLSLHVWLSS